MRAAGGGAHAFMLATMLELRGKLRPSALADQVFPSGDDQVGRFLVESEGRVVTHCRRLLERQTWQEGERRRLTRLLNEAETRLQVLLTSRADISPHDATNAPTPAARF